MIDARPGLGKREKRTGTCSLDALIKAESSGQERISIKIKSLIKGVNEPV